MIECDTTYPRRASTEVLIGKWEWDLTIKTKHMFIVIVHEVSMKMILKSNVVRTFYFDDSM